MKRKGMLLSVYRDLGSDCTNGGVSKYAKHVIVCGDGIPEIIDGDAETPILEFVNGEQGGKRTHLRPLGETRWTMFGGNFAYTCDSRMSKFNHGLPIPIFDRIE